MTEADLQLIQRWRVFTFQAADALWDISKGKRPMREPREINQDIYALIPELDAVIDRLKKETETPFIQKLPV
ncbi:MAG: hypothetical protein NTX72_00805 [Candidatus Uhrbacteria bacterium]|nr:hypothetical protein [Candidatus Uhrbacteria bacterium]